MIVGTAGHIDHGKTALVKALTGIDADRLPEEKARGITVDLGFAYADFPSGARIGFVDAPGHEKLVRTMVAGATGIDFALLVVAADDGIMPQTREHVAIFHLLGLTRGAVALTKIDRVDSARRAAVAAELRAALDATSLSGAAILPCSSVTGEGIADIAALLDSAAQAALRPAPAGNFRLAVDRCFTLTGIGLVVTGVVHAGSARAGETLMLSPGGIEARLRGLRVQDAPADETRTGDRCALNLSGARLEKSGIQRGDWIVAADAHAPVARFDAELTLLPSEEKPLRSWTPIHLHLGAADVTARISPLDTKALAPGQSGLVQIVADSEIGALWGDRFVIRDQSARRTIGGGRAIDPFPPRRGARKPARLAALTALTHYAPQDALAALASDASAGIDLGQFRMARNLTSAEAQEAEAAARILSADTGKIRLGFSTANWAALADEIREAFDAYQSRHPDSPGATADEIVRGFASPRRPAAMAALKGLIAAGGIARFGQLLHLPGHEATLSSEDENLWQEVRAALAQSGYDQPRLVRLAEQLGVAEVVLTTLLNLLQRIGRVRRIGKAYFLLPETVALLAHEAAASAAEHPDALLTVGRFRDRTGVTRHMVMPLMEYFDKVGLTERVDAGRQLRREWREIAGAKCEDA